MHSYRNLTVVVAKHQMFYCNGIIIYCRGVNVMLWAFGANPVILKACVAKLMCYCAG